MRSWLLSNESPLNLTFSADYRTSHPDYTNDHTWELAIGRETPRALALRTTYGLRAGRMMLFPRFHSPEGERIDPSLFPGAPQIHQFLPNYALVSFQPYSSLMVESAYWLADSNLVTGRFVFNNTTDHQIDFLFEWVCLLKPFENGKSMAPQAYGINHVLQGHTADLHPVCVMTGGVQPGVGTYPSLALQVELLPGQKRQIQWALSSLDSPQKSFELARLATARRWDAEIARLQLINEQSTIEIHTGDPDWDACLAMAQTTAQRLILPPSPRLPYPTFVLSRQPDHGNSLRKDGSDYPYLWNGQTALDAAYLSSLLFPGGLHIAKGLVENFIFTQDESGAIDWKPGLSGQRSGMLAQPILANLVWEIFQTENDRPWLEKIYPHLYRFIRVWFDPENDRDQDGYPEWCQPLQTGIPDSPLYDSWHRSADHSEIQLIECPSLAAMLYRECDCLLRMADILKDESTVDWLAKRKESLRKHIAAGWDERASTYRYRDAQSHLSQKGMALRRFKGNRNIAYRRNLKQLSRLQIQLILENENTRPIKIELNGTGEAGEIRETFLFQDFTWLGNHATATSQQLFLSIARVSIQGLSDQEEMLLSTVNHQQEDLSLLLPLWAGVPSPQQAEKIVKKNVLTRYLQPFGLALTPCDEDVADHPYQCTVPVIWNDLLLRGLIHYGYRQEAATIFNHLMRAIIRHLKEEHTFSATYHAITGGTSGEKNTLPGLPPVGLFLNLCGIRKLNPNEVILEGEHIFPWPVALKYKGMTITRHAHDTVVHFPGGQSVTVDGPGPHHIQLMVDHPGKE